MSWTAGGDARAGEVAAAIAKSLGASAFCAAGSLGATGLDTGAEKEGWAGGG